MKAMPALKKLLDEAAHETSPYRALPLPIHDLHGLIANLESAWGSMHRMLASIEGAARLLASEAPASREAYLQEAGTLNLPRLYASFGSHGAPPLLAAFHTRAGTMLKLGLEVTGHMLLLLGQHPAERLEGEAASVPREYAEPSSELPALPPGLKPFQAETHAACHVFDHEWAPKLAEELLRNAARASRSDDAKRNFFVLWLETTQTIASLDYVCRYTTYAAQRLGNIIVKRKPSASLMPKPADLYAFQVEV